MDLYTANAAQTLHAQNAQRAARELEYRRIAKERAIELAASQASAGVVVAARPRRLQGLIASLFLRAHRATAH